MTVTAIAKSMLQPVRRGLDRAADWAMFERRFDTDTGGRIRLEDLGLPAEDRIYYLPTPWLSFRQAMNHLEVGPDDVFADIGSGKGRVVLMAAADYPFKRVIGVELSDALNTIARENVERNRSRLRCQAVELVTTDALAWQVPDDLTIAYFYYPFFGQVFKAVVGHLIASIDRNPRPFHVVYNCPKDAHTLLETGRAREVASFRLRYMSIYELLPA